MNFVSLQFLSFTLVAWLIYWGIRPHNGRKFFLVVISFLFYAVWDWRFCGLMAFVTANAYVVGRLLPSLSNRGRRWLLGASISIDLLVLGFFKYYGFFVSSFNDLMVGLGFASHLPVLQILLPVGISFYTFHAISYVVDVYRGKVQAEHSGLNIALYIAFFPQLIAGPIVRSSFFMPQLHRPRRFSKAQQFVGLRQIARGFIYKAVIADTLAQFVDPAYGNVSGTIRADLLIAAFAFYAQIYFDFAGYSNMAIGTARLFGYRLPPNFNFPYAARSLTDFWRRWHMSLSFWLRDYVYIGLGGNRGSKLAGYRNLMITMLLGGLWHGASWTYVFWGFLHGLGLCVHKLWMKWPRRWSLPAWPRAALALLLTQGAVFVGWIFFRAESFADALTVLKAVFVISAWTHRIEILISILLVVAADHLYGLYGRRFKAPSAIMVQPLYWVSLGAIVALAIMLMQGTEKAFIYFQF